MSDTSKRFTIFMAVLLSVVMVASVMLPLLTSNIQVSHVGDPIVPTDVPPATIPPPPDVASLAFDEDFLHPSGLYTVAVPTGWTPTIVDNTPSEARVSMFNGEQLSVIESRVMPAGEELAGIDGLGDFFNESWLSNTWRDYNTWAETGRAVEDDRLILDFSLARSGQNFIARQESWTDGEWIYMVRVLTPNNASAELQDLLARVSQTVNPVTAYQGQPLDWGGYYDATDKHLIRFPNGWTVTDAGDGTPATIVSGDIVLRVEGDSTTIADEDEAQAWVEASRSNVSVNNVEAVERGDFSGYAVSYTLETLDGDSESGLAILLNGNDDRLHVANLRVAGVDVDLNDAGIQEAYGDAIAVLNSFNLFPDLEVDTTQ